MEKEVGYLLLTVLFELPVALLLLRQEDWRRVVLVVLGLNLVTHPVAWLFITNGASWHLVELALTLFEAGALALIFPRHARAFLAGILMNLISALLGLFF